MNLYSTIPTDGYKVGHHMMYPENTVKVVSNFTPRNVKYMPNEAKDIVVFGIQYTFKKINDLFNKEFFKSDEKKRLKELYNPDSIIGVAVYKTKIKELKDSVIENIKLQLDSYTNTDYDTAHLSRLWDLGYLPIKVNALEEGTILTKTNIPILVYQNTIDEFFWVTNFLETLISAELWKPMHSASISFGAKKLVNKFALETDKDNLIATDFQNHDFSFRGMQSLESATSSGLGFLTSSLGTDTLPTLQAANYYYNTPNAAFSVFATEHAVMTAYGKETEIEGFERLINLFPTGILSLVSDSYDFFKVHTETIYKLKDKILNRDGKIVFRGDSGDPCDIICGTSKYFGEGKTPEEKGQIELLWECFGGTINNQGYKVLDSHVGAIYGDGINFERANEILNRLKQKGFASTNIIFGWGSYSMGYATRDNQGSAVKATYIERLINEKRVGIPIFKDPKTDSNKKSAKGLLTVLKEDNNLILKDECSWEEFNSSENQLKPIFENGKFLQEVTLDEIRERINKLV